MFPRGKFSDYAGCQQSPKRSSRNDAEVYFAGGENHWPRSVRQHNNTRGVKKSGSRSHKRHKFVTAMVDLLIAILLRSKLTMGICYKIYINQTQDENPDWRCCQKRFIRFELLAVQRYQTQQHGYEHYFLANFADTLAHLQENLSEDSGESGEKGESGRGYYRSMLKLERSWELLLATIAGSMSKVYCEFGKIHKYLYLQNSEGEFYQFPQRMQL